MEQTAALSPWMDPKIWIAVAVVMVPVVMWFARLEFVTKANEKRQKEFETNITSDIRLERAATAADMKDDRDEHRALKKAFYEHATDTRVHHNEEMFKEFRAGIDRRFSGLEGTLGDINRKLDHLAGRE